MSTSKTKTAPARKPAAAATPDKSVTSAASPATAPKSTAAKPAVPAAKPVTPDVVGSAETVVLGPVMRKKELIERAVTRSGIKKKDAKPVVEAVLAELGIALSENREMNLPPFGKLKVRREKKLPNGRVMVVKVRQADAQTSEMPDAAE